MNLFLDSQGITEVRDYTLEIAKEIKMSWGLDIPDEIIKCGLGDIGIVYGGNRKEDFLIVEIAEGEIKSQKEIKSDKSRRAEFLQQRAIELIDYLMRNGNWDKMFEEIRIKWNIGSPREMFEATSAGGNLIYIPSLIKNNNFKKDIRMLCKKLKRRSKEDLWLVVAYVLFGELLFRVTGEIVYHYHAPLRLFKVQSCDGSKVYIEVSHSLNKKEWENICSVISEEALNEGFIAGDGKIDTLGKFLGDNTPDGLNGKIVFSIPEISDEAEMVKLFKGIRKQLNGRYGSYRIPRSKELNQRNGLALELSKQKESENLTDLDIYFRVIDKLGLEDDELYSDDAIRQARSRQNKKRVEPTEEELLMDHVRIDLLLEEEDRRENYSDELHQELY